MSPKYIVLLVLIYLNAVKSEGPSWDYNDTSKWGENYKQCNGKMQSPIHIETMHTIVNPLFSSPLIFHNYDIPLEDVILHNNGNGVEAQIPKPATGERPSISGGPFGRKIKFEAQYFQFHWKYESIWGTEHWVNDGSHSMEMQIVHKNAENDFSVVLGIFLDGSPEPDHSLYMIFNQLPNVTTYGSNATIDNNFKLGDLLYGLNTEKFYFYQGSLTTPPCSDAYWYIFKGYIQIPDNEVEKFWQILDKNNETFSNIRPELPLNDRKVYKSYAI